jgi:SAM-dependent methyltransferase
VAAQVVDALLALAAGDPDGAAAVARAAAAADPGARLPPLLAAHLAGPGGSGVYDEPRAFAAFISGGGNVGLYAATIAALRAWHERRGTLALADVGCGDGRVTAGVIPPTCARVDLVEPSAALLAAATGRLAAAGVESEVVAHEATLSGWLAALPDGVRRDAAQATFALHAVEPGERRRALAALRDHVGALAVAEFDVPGFADRGPDHAAYAAERYERGLAEYADGSDVGPGFLVPVLVGQFDPARPRLTWEQPLAAWVEDLAAAGWTVESTTPLHDYWWAPAHLVVAQG